MTSETGLASGRRPGITVLGSAAIDRVDDAPPSPGGCPSFAEEAVGAFAGEARVVTRFAAGDAQFFAGVVGRWGTAATVLPSRRTHAFGLSYAGDRRSMTVEEIGDPWTVEEIGAGAIETTWVHVAGLLRGDFPAATLRALAAGHLVSYDGQGLVRPRRLGRLEVDAGFEGELLKSVRVLKLADDEAGVLRRGAFDLAAAGDLGVPEILVTYGSEGCDLFWGGRVSHIPAERKVTGVNSTGAGDVFSVAYVAGRAGGESPESAARTASRLVTEMLEARRSAAAGEAGG